MNLDESKGEIIEKKNMEDVKEYWEKKLDEEIEERKSRIAELCRRFDERVAAAEKEKAIEMEQIRPNIENSEKILELKQIIEKLKSEKVTLQAENDSKNKSLNSAMKEKEEYREKCEIEVKKSLQLKEEFERTRSTMESMIKKSEKEMVNKEAMAVYVEKIKVENEAALETNKKAEGVVAATAGARKSAKRENSEEVAKIAKKEKDEEIAKIAKREKDEKITKIAKRKNGEEIAKIAKRENDEKIAKIAKRKNCEGIAKIAKREKGERIAKIEKKEKGEDVAKIAKRENKEIAKIVKRKNDNEEIKEKDDELGNGILKVDDKDEDEEETATKAKVQDGGTKEGSDDDYSDDDSDDDDVKNDERKENDDNERVVKGDEMKDESKFDNENYDKDDVKNDDNENDEKDDEGSDDEEKGKTAEVAKNEDESSVDESTEDDEEVNQEQINEIKQVQDDEEDDQKVGANEDISEEAFVANQSQADDKKQKEARKPALIIAKLEDGFMRVEVMANLDGSGITSKDVLSGVKLDIEYVQVLVVIAAWANLNVSAISYNQFVEYVGDCKSPDIKVEKDKLCFKGNGGIDKKDYGVELKLLNEIDPEKSKYAVQPRAIDFALKKKDARPYCNWLLETKVKQHWLKVDFLKWKEEDDSGDESYVYSSYSTFKKLNYTSLVMRRDTVKKCMELIEEIAKYKDKLPNFHCQFDPGIRCNQQVGLELLGTEPQFSCEQRRASAQLSGGSERDVHGRGVQVERLETVPQFSGGSDVGLVSNSAQKFKCI